MPKYVYFMYLFIQISKKIKYIYCSFFIIENFMKNIEFTLKHNCPNRYEELNNDA